MYYILTDYIIGALIKCITWFSKRQLKSTNMLVISVLILLIKLRLKLSNYDNKIRDD